MTECEHCGGDGGKRRDHKDPWGAVYSHDIWCDDCENSWEPPEPDLNAVSATERYEMAWRQKESLR